MASEGPVPGASPRVHVVLVPGFAGFDALGQMEYYAGVTPLFRRWKAADALRCRVALHYFDSFPTAAVGTRAERLGRYLAKRVARGEFQRGDGVALVGHSTGGLDIRCLLWALAQTPQKAIQVDGGTAPGDAVTAEDILNLVRRAVFLSVPQRGTNIADWVRAHDVGRRVLVADLRAAVYGSDVPVVDRVQRWFAGSAASLTEADLFRAVQDVLREADPELGTPGPARTASAHEAAAHVALWLQHIASDFAAIDDLTAQPAEDRAASPAHFTPEMREEEIWRWQRRGILTRSYATLGRRPFQFPGHDAPRWDLLKPWTYPECAAEASTDVVYRACYRACAGGPFIQAAPWLTRALATLSDAQRETIAGWAGHDTIEPWDNDGIVNTASMFWPEGARTVLVPGDHMDIVGHYQPVLAHDGGSRRHQSYDLLGSGSGFDDAAFGAVWEDVFGFCCDEASVAAQAGG